MNPLAFLRRPHCTNWCHSLGKPPVVYKPGSFLWGIAILYIYIYIYIYIVMEQGDFEVVINIYREKIWVLFGGDVLSAVFPR